MDLDQLHRILKVMVAGCFIVAALAAVGEFLGWWHDFGELLFFAATGLGLLLAVATFFLGATKDQVRLVVAGVTATNAKLDGANLKLGAVAATLDGIDRDVREGNEKLDGIGHDVRDGNAKLEKLDSIDARLDQQTDLLRQIRDRL